MRVGTSAGGARAKAVIAWNPRTNEVRSGQAEAGAGFEHWLLKFDGVSGGDQGEEADGGRGYGVIEYAYHRMAFNVFARNQDDHVKNVAFLMDRAGNWSLAPAFDVTCAFQPEGRWTSTHRMTLNGKRDGFTLEDFRACARAASMKRGRADAICHTVREVVSRWPEYADGAGVDPDRRDRTWRALRVGARVRDALQ